MPTYLVTTYDEKTQRVDRILVTVVDAYEYPFDVAATLLAGHVMMLFAVPVGKATADKDIVWPSDESKSAISATGWVESMS